MTDDGTIIKEFDTIASAVKEVGVNSKVLGMLQMEFKNMLEDTAGNTKISR